MRRGPRSLGRAAGACLVLACVGVLGCGESHTAPPPTPPTPPAPGCTESGECAALGLVCDPTSEACVACLVDSDCRPPNVTCRPIHVCTPRPRCRSAGCPPGSVCNLGWDACVECVLDTDCAGENLCRGSTCVTREAACELDLACGALGLVCDLASATCVAGGLDAATATDAGGRD